MSSSPKRTDQRAGRDAGYNGGPAVKIQDHTAYAQGYAEGRDEID
jgi:hypothetical protein